MISRVTQTVKIAESRTRGQLGGEGSSTLDPARCLVGKTEQVQFSSKIRFRSSANAKRIILYVVTTKISFLIESGRSPLGSHLEETS